MSQNEISDKILRISKENCTHKCILLGQYSLLNLLNLEMCIENGVSKEKKSVSAVFFKPAELANRCRSRLKVMYG